jgi:hypothetical protein
MHERRTEIEHTEEERRQRQIELSLAQFDALLANDEEPTEEDVELFKEFMRDIDAHRGARKLFTDYLK